MIHNFPGFASRGTLPTIGDVALCGFVVSDRMVPEPDQHERRCPTCVHLVAVLPVTALLPA